MNYKELVCQISEETKIPVRQVQEVVKLMFDKIAKAIDENTRISAPGVRIHTVKREPREAVGRDGLARAIPARIYGRLTRVPSKSSDPLTTSSDSF
jgi:hypothetical protein